MRPGVWVDTLREVSHGDLAAVAARYSAVAAEPALTPEVATRLGAGPNSAALERVTATVALNVALIAIGSDMGHVTTGVHPDIAQNSVELGVRKVLRKAGLLMSSQSRCPTTVTLPLKHAHRRQHHVTRLTDLPAGISLHHQAMVRPTFGMLYSRIPSITSFSGSHRREWRLRLLGGFRTDLQHLNTRARQIMEATRRTLMVGSGLGGAVTGDMVKGGGGGGRSA